MDYDDENFLGNSFEFNNYYVSSLWHSENFAATLLNFQMAISVINGVNCKITETTKAKRYGTASVLAELLTVI